MKVLEVRVMFIDKYLNNTKLKLLYKVYNDEYIENLDENNFINIYNIFKNYNFYFIDDIILNYLEIFTLNPNNIKRKLLELKKTLGNDYLYIIGNDLRYLEIMLD